jgi:hypothetical protein
MMTIENAKRDGVSFAGRHGGPESAGAKGLAKPGQYLHLLVKLQPSQEYLQVPLRYQALLNSTGICNATLQKTHGMIGTCRYESFLPPV